MEHCDLCRGLPDWNHSVLLSPLTCHCATIAFSIRIVFSGIHAFLERLSLFLIGKLVSIRHHLQPNQWRPPWYKGGDLAHEHSQTRANPAPYITRQLIHNFVAISRPVHLLSVQIFFWIRLYWLSVRCSSFLNVFCEQYETCLLISMAKYVHIHIYFIKYVNL